MLKKYIFFQIQPKENFKKNNYQQNQKSRGQKSEIFQKKKILKTFKILKKKNWAWSICFKLKFPMGP